MPLLGDLQTAKKMVIPILCLFYVIFKEIEENICTLTSSSRSPMSSRADVCLRLKDSNSARIPGNKVASALSASH